MIALLAGWACTSPPPGTDADGDGSPSGSDCDDANAAIFPGGEEVCDGADNDCDGEEDEDATDAVTWYADADRDGRGDPAMPRSACRQPDGYQPDDSDCDDANASVHPGADETCNGIDDDCDGAVDDEEDEDPLDLGTWYADLDSDGYGDPAAGTSGCEQPSGTVLDATDCDDAREDVHPDMDEVCGDGLDNDCDGDEGACEEALSGRPVLTGEADHDTAGWSVAGPGDIDGDGIGDLFVGAPGFDGGEEEAGAAYLVLGPVTGEESLATAEGRADGEAHYDRAGTAVAGAGDADADGTPDLLVGAPGHDGGGTAAGVAWVVPGPGLGTAAARWALAGPASAGAGHAVAGVADTDGDGFDDVAVGGPGFEQAGAAWIVWGPVDGDSSLQDADATWTGEASGDRAGWSVAAAGDTDGDGRADVLIGAPGSDRAWADGGAAYLVRGGADGTRSLDRADLALLGAAEGDQAGRAVSGGGDLDGVRGDDLLVGAWLHDTDVVANLGAAYTVGGLGTGSVSLDDAAGKGEGRTAGSYAGWSVAGPGDVDGDGAADVLTGAWNDSSGGGSSGAALLFLSEVRAAMPGTAGEERVGWSVAGPGDLDGDGLPDLLIGAPGDASVGSASGAAWIVYGREEW